MAASSMTRLLCCGTHAHTHTPLSWQVVCVTIPFVFRYLLAELAAMNINVLCQV
jgi:DNA-directed RNA polymerase beta subunit